MKKKRKLLAVVLMCIMALGLTVTAFAATPSVAKFTKANGNNLALGMGTGVIQSCDLTDGVATVTTKSFSLLFYTGTIEEITGNSVTNWSKPVATIDMTYDDGTGLAGVPVHLTFDFNILPPGMSDEMDARFVCE